MDIQHMKLSARAENFRKVISETKSCVSNGDNLNVEFATEVVSP